MSPVLGGRIRTDPVGGFLLDRGFQVLLTAYPEAQNVLDYKSLKLRDGGNPNPMSCSSRSRLRCRRPSEAGA